MRPRDTATEADVYIGSPYQDYLTITADTDGDRDYADFMRDLGNGTFSDGERDGAANGY